MCGPYDNEKGRYLEVPELDNGDWYIGPNSELYIMPADGLIVEPEGPDDDVLESLLAIYNKLDEKGEKPDPRAIADKLGIDYGLPVLHRFSPDIGYFSA